MWAARVAVGCVLLNSLSIYAYLYLRRLLALLHRGDCASVSPMLGMAGLKINLIIAWSFAYEIQLDFSCR